MPPNEVNEEEAMNNDQRLNLALDSAQMGAWDLDLLRDQAWRSRRHDQIFGYDSLLPEWGFEIFLNHVVEEDRTLVKKNFEEAFAQGQFNMDCRIRWPDQSVHWITAKGHLYRNEKGDPIRLMGVVLNIDARKELERTLAQRAEELAEAERLKSELFANVSHELRTPLTLILSPLESLLGGEHGLVSSDHRQLLVNVHHNAVRLLEMITGLLDFAKVDAGRIEVQREPTEIVSLTRAILTNFTPLMEQKSLRSQLNIDAPEVAVQMDRYLYERILFNLLSNAVKFTPPNGTITVSLFLAEDRLRLTVADTGMGIAASDLPHLFQKFRRLEGAITRRFEGTGLGLAIVKELSHLLEGTTSVASKPGAGSTFTVECLAPRAEVLPEEISLLSSRPSLAIPFSSALPYSEPLVSANSPSQATILLAEDNPVLAYYIATLLQELGSVHLARDGEEALTLVRRLSPDLILSDVMMPKRDGLNLCKEVKSNPETAVIPVVLLTALTDRDSLLKGWEAGADEYLFKPFHPRELVTRIKFMLSAVQERSRAKKALALQAAELARSNTELQQFAYVASHDLQEPLRKVQAFGDLLAESCGPALSDEGRDYLRRMQNAAGRMQLLINDLLVYSRVTSQARPFVKVDLGQTAREVVADLEIRLRDTRGQVDIGELPSIDADPMQMRQLLQNLLVNALKFHRQNTPPLVTIHARTVVVEDGTAETPFSQPLAVCEILVTDNGIGFDEKYLDRIFSPFQRLHGRNQFEGSGIGLAICRKIVERHGGTITARSTLGSGSTFIVRLPHWGQKGIQHE